MNCPPSPPSPPLVLPWCKENPVLLACSGGGDSLALLCLLQEQGWTVEVAHLDHAGRPDSQLQASQLQQLCQAWGLVFHGRRLQVQRWARRYGMSWEAAARELRYRWLSALASRRGALLVTAHTADDQAETVLMRMLTGTTLVGLGGIYPRGGGVLGGGAPPPLEQGSRGVLGGGDQESSLARPVLNWRRSQLRQVLLQRKISWFEDPANRDPRFLRTRIRALLPELEQLNSGAVAHLCQLAADARELRPLLTGSRQVLQMSRLELEELLHQSWLQLQPGPGIRWARIHSHRIWTHLREAPRRWQSWNLPGDCWAEWEAGRLALGRRVEIPLQAPSGHRWRYRQVGDRWGRVLLKDQMRTWKVPRRGRDGLPVLLSEERPAQILALWGYALQPEVEGLVLLERSGLVIVEAPPHEQLSPHSTSRLQR